MKFVTDITTAALAGILVYIMRSFGEGPLVRIDLGSTDIAHLS
jgi:hypothetical protein